jgi:hypothetical protein
MIFVTQGETMEPTQLHEDDFLTILWHDSTGIIAIDWKASTASMTDEDMKNELLVFAGRVEENRASGILVDVEKFRHRMGTEAQQWRVQNISPRYSAAGVKRFAFLFPPDAEIPAAMNQSAEGEAFLTRAFNSRQQAIAWLKESGR